MQWHQCIIFRHWTLHCSSWQIVESCSLHLVRPPSRLHAPIHIRPAVCLVRWYWHRKHACVDSIWLGLLFEARFGSNINWNWLRLRTSRRVFLRPWILRCKIWGWQLVEPCWCLIYETNDFAVSLCRQLWIIIYMYSYFFHTISIQ